MKNQPVKVVKAQVFRLAFSGGLKSHSREKLSIKSDGHFELDLPDSIRFFSAGDIIMIYNDNKMTANIYIYQCIYIYVCVCVIMRFGKNITEVTKQSWRIAATVLSFS